MTKEEGKENLTLTSTLHGLFMEESADSLATTEKELGCESCPADMDSAITGQLFVERNCNTCSCPSTAGPANTTLSAPGDIQTEVAEKLPPPTTCTCDQADVHPSTENQDLPQSCISTITDMDCPVCFNKYDIYRVPKQLSCKHTFCIVCLKLLTRHEEATWLISCPVCRASTAVFGGLINTLPNQESLMSRLEYPAPVERTDNKGKFIGQYHPGPEEETQGSLKVAAKRLVALLLILLILLIIILQFVYSGMLKWVLGFFLGVVGIITVLLCFNQSCSIKAISKSSTHQKDNYIISTV
ncbi:E3 ubiquitin-protein ligase RNF186 [Rhinophrynus dorsalis]